MTKTLLLLGYDYLLNPNKSCTYIFVISRHFWFAVGD